MKKLVPQGPQAPRDKQPRRRRIGRHPALHVSGQILAGDDANPRLVTVSKKGRRVQLAVVRKFLELRFPGLKWTLDERSHSTWCKRVT